jgi:DNA-binding winged helix-turn-helix (wHTH) protein
LKRIKDSYGGFWEAFWRKEVGVIYVFGDYELDTDRYELRYGGEPVQVEPKVFDLLTYLVQHHDHVISKETLLKQIWAD